MTDTIRSVQYESLFKAWNLTFRYAEAVSLADIHLLAGAQVRDLENRAIPENVEQFALQMKAGAQFPPIIVWENNVIDGNTRLAAAHKLDRASIGVYYLTLPDVKMAKALAAAINQLGGQRLTPVEIRQQAINLMELDFTDARISQHLGCTAEAARQWRKLVEVSERAERTGVTDKITPLSKNHKMALGQVKHDQPFAELVKAAADGRPDAKAVKEVVARIADATSDDAALAVVTDARNEWVPIGPEPGKTRVNKAAQQARMHMGGLLKHHAEDLVDPAKVESDLPKWKQLADLAAKVLELYARSGSTAA
jgi:ParB-like chromosome segregation protein Spo0J